MGYGTQAVPGSSRSVTCRGKVWCRRAWQGIPGSAGFEPHRHLLLADVEEHAVHHLEVVPAQRGINLSRPAIVSQLKSCWVGTTLNIGRLGVRTPLRSRRVEANTGNAGRCTQDGARGVVGNSTARIGDSDGEEEHESNETAHLVETRVLGVKKGGLFRQFASVGTLTQLVMVTSICLVLVSCGAG